MYFKTYLLEMLILEKIFPIVPCFIISKHIPKHFSNIPYINKNNNSDDWPPRGNKARGFVKTYDHGFDFHLGLIFYIYTVLYPVWPLIKNKYDY